MSTRRQVKVVKCPLYDQNRQPGDVTYDQNPYPGDIPHDQTPVVSPTPAPPPPPPSWGLTRCIRSPLLYRLSYKVRREQAVGTEDVKVTAMNMYKYKKGLRFFANIGRVALYI